MHLPFSTDQDPGLDQVGGKAASLIRLRQAGFPVPDGSVLTASFFKPWTDALERSGAWQDVLQMMADLGRGQPDLGARAALAAACDRAKAIAAELPLGTDQQQALAALEPLNGPFAVRSSSPEEDLAGASFAGQYESVLNVAPADIEDAVRTCFASCLDARVLLYKHEMQFETFVPAIAVVVQHLVPADVAGVAFSINPLTNDFDEVLINASWGLGEALVSGDITPDSAVVNKVDGAVVQNKPGDKGGDRSGETCLDDKQLLQLQQIVSRIEDHYGQPMDVEWAVADDTLHIVQARPITTYIPLTPAMKTEPGEQRHLYIDCYLMDGITMSGTTSPMANDQFHTVLTLLLEWMIGPYNPQRLADYGIVIREAGRCYMDLSLYLGLMGTDVMALKTDQMNKAMSALITSPELDRYRLEHVPPHMSKWRMGMQSVPALWRMRRAFTVVVGAMMKGTDAFAPNCHRLIEAFNTWARSPINYDESVREAFEDGLVRAGKTIIDSSYPAFMLVYFDLMRLGSMIDQDNPEQVRLISDLNGGHEQDMVVQMGICLYDLAQLLDADQMSDLNATARAIEQRSMPDAFMHKWDEFMTHYGHRGPFEMDIIQPRYGDDPLIALQQIRSLAKAGGDFNPHQMHEARVKAREAAFARLSEILPPRKAKKLRKMYATAFEFNGMREMFKEHLTQVYHRSRKLLVHRAEAFIAAGRLDRVEQIFELEIDDVDRAHGDPSVDVRALVAERGAIFHNLKSHVRHFPMAIDSRGRIARGDIDQGDLPEGTLAGASLSPGSVTGPIKVLNDPFEKEVEPGDILVAVTTDPGWTPLFINAGAVILEIGGEMQHGALVAREYGKPCIAGIPDVTRVFSDGQMVEVDGDNGLVRVLS